MYVTLTIIMYPARYIPFALLAMALQRFPLWLNRRISFFKLMGTGKNGTFDKHPEWKQWAILAVHNQKHDSDNLNETDIINNLYGKFISKWLRAFSCETCTFFLEPTHSHGQWDGKQPFVPIKPGEDNIYPIAVLTRATIHLNKLKSFWQNVPAVEKLMRTAPGLIYSAGIGETPWIKQATFSIWNSAEEMMDFAYRKTEHREVIKKTREQEWYKEEMFSRFNVIKCIGTISGANPLQNMI